MARAALLCIICLVAAGCASPSQEAGPSSPPAEVQRALHLTSCSEQIGIFPVANDDVSPYLPDGFEPMPALPPDFYQDPDPSGQTATLLLLGFDCDDAALFVAYLPVVPPEAVRLEGAYYHAVALPCIADTATAAVLELWSVPCTPGAVEISADLDLDVGALWRLDAQDDGVHLVLQGAAPASMTPAGPELVRAFHVDAQQVCAVVDVRVEPHEHWQFAAATLGVQGPAAFPVPEHPGMSSLGRPGFAMNFTHAPQVETGPPCPSDA